MNTKCKACESNQPEHCFCDRFCDCHPDTVTVTLLRESNQCRQVIIDHVEASYSIGDDYD